MVKPQSSPIVTTTRGYIDANAPGANFWEDESEAGDGPVSAEMTHSEIHGNENMAGRLIPRTDRQMELDQNIYGLRMKMLSLNDELSKGMMDSEAYDAEIQSFKARISRLEALESSGWALERTDEVPKDLFL